MYLPTTLHRQDVTKLNFKPSLTRFKTEFSFFWTGCLTKGKEHSLFYYLPITAERIIRFMLFPRILVLCNMQSALTKIWTRGHFIRRQALHHSMYIYMCVCVCVCIRYVSWLFLDGHLKLSSILENSLLLLYILWDDWPIFRISGSNEQLQQKLEYTPLKPDCHSWWISKMQSGRENTLEERYEIKFCFKLARNATETYGMLQTAFRPSCMNRVSVFEWHKRFKEGVSVRSLWGMMRSVGGVRKSINQSWLVKGLGLGLVCWGFKGVQEEIPSEEASILQIASVAFLPGQCTSLQLHPCHRLFEQDGHQDSSSASLKSRPCSLWLLVIP